MEPRERIALWLRPAFFLGHNVLTLIGAVLATSSALTMIAFWVFEVLGGGEVNPYVGILILLILPGIFVFGLILIPAGVYWRWRKLRKKGELPDKYPRIDLGQPALRRGVGLVAAMTVV